MYNVSRLYEDKISSSDRIFELNIRIVHEDGILDLTDKDIGLGSFKVVDSSQSGEEFTIGGVVAKHLEFTLVNKDKYDNINFIGAKVIPTVKILIREAIDAHFLQPSQPSKMLGFDDLWEYIPLGQFNIDVADRLRNTIEIKAIDNMILLDKPYSLSNIQYPATLSRILSDICSIAGVGVPNLNFPNNDYVVNKKPEGEYTLRVIVGFIAELSGSFAKFDRVGRLSMNWYEPTPKIITKHQRSEFKVADYSIQITGVRFDSKDKDEDDNQISYIIGTEDYMIDISGNELLQNNYETIMSSIMDRVESVKFIPYEASWHGDPAMDVGDMVTHIDIDGIEYNTIITNTNYKYRGTSTMSAKAIPNISRGFKSTDNRIAKIISRVEADFESEMSNLQQEQLRATELIGGMLGGYVHNLEDALYVTDSPIFEDSVKIWKWGIGGFGFSDDGGETYTTGITIDGSIVANIISANHINTGTLSSNNGKTWIDLDNGYFNLGGTSLDKNGFKVILDNGNSVENEIKSSETSLKQYVDSIELSVKDYADGIESSVKQYADGIVSSVENTMGDKYSSLSQTVSGISSTVNTINSNYATTSQITQLSNQISTKVSSSDITGNLIASRINQSSTTVTIDASRINLNGITRVNSNLKIGTRDGVFGRIDFNDRSYIRTSGSYGWTLELSAVEMRTNVNQLHLTAPNIYFNPGVTIHNAPFTMPYHDSNYCYIDYGSGSNKVTVRNSSGTVVGYLSFD